jgi:hydroxyethylthiazole kinase-like uncharacterized protein yjeF
MTKILNAGQMRKADEKTIREYGIHGLILMENAGLGVMRALESRFADLRGKRIVIVSGKGNNGGDGFVVARHLQRTGTNPEVMLLARIEDLKGDAGTNAVIARNIGVSILEITESRSLEGCMENIRSADIIVDAIFGTGLTHPASGLHADAIRLINESRAFVVSVDLPSGLSSDKAEIIGPAVQADVTVTLACPKYCHVFPPAERLVGELVVADIGMPEAVVDLPENFLNWVDAAAVSQIDLSRPSDAHKGQYGHLLVVAGSRGKSGAAWMTGFSALKIGAGLVTVAAPENVQPVVASMAAELMTEALPETESGAVSPRALERVTRLLDGKNAVALGPGLSLEAEAQTFIRELLCRLRVPCIVDADGLNALDGHLDVLKKAPRPLILTPHPGEMARLLDRPIAEVQASRVDIAREFALEHGAHLVLKGYRTVIAAPDGRVFVNSTGNPGMATGGSGDILTGMLAGLAAQRLDPTEAAVLGVYLHGLSGDLAARELGMAFLTATNLLDYLPDAMETIGKA